MRLRYMTGVAVCAVALSACSGSNATDSSVTNTEAPAEAVENYNTQLINAQYLANQGGDNGSCYTGSRYGACAVVKNLAVQWDANGELQPFGFSWDQVLNHGPEDRSTSGYAHGSGNDRPFTQPGPMTVGIVKIESAGAGAIGSFTFRPNSTDPALQSSAFESWVRVPAAGKNSAMCSFSGLVGCFIGEIYPQGGAVAFQPNSYTGTDYADFPCNAGLCQEISGVQGLAKDAHPQVNFTSITAPVAIEVKNNSSGPLTYAGQVGGDGGLVLSNAAKMKAVGETIEKGETATFYGYRSMVGDVARLDLQFTTPDGATVTTKTALASKGGNPVAPSCNVAAGRDISKRFNCDATNPYAEFKGSSGMSVSPSTTVTYSIRS